MESKPNIIQFSILGIVIGIVMLMFGVVSSGAGHGPYPQESMGLAILGVVVIAVSLLVLLITAISRLSSKK